MGNDTIIAIINQGRIVERAAMRQLLRRLNLETFVLTVRGDIRVPPQLDGYPVQVIDEETLEVSVAHEKGINRVFASLSEQGIEVLSLRNKQNRLEQLFMDMLRNGRTA